MNVLKSLQFKLILGIFAVLVPLVAYHLYNNYYAVQIVREKVASSNNDLVNMFIQSKVDQVLEDTGKYLLTRAGSDPDVMSLNLFDYSDGEYQLRKVRIINRFRDDLALYNAIDAFFIYSRSNVDLTLSDGNYENFDELASWMHLSGSSLNSRWTIIQNAGDYGLVTAVQVTPDVSIGAWIDLGSFLAPFSQLNLGGGGEVMIVDAKGNPLTATSLTREGLDYLRPRLDKLESEYLILEQADGKQLAVGMKSKLADIQVIVLVPEQNLLQKLPFFQWAAWLIPIGSAFVLSLYVLLLKRVLFKPLSGLIRGMRRIIQGDLNFRLEADRTSELSFLASTYNNMADQIKQLRIGIYEQELQAKRAELKHLQVQINPHFYLNSLHIIYNLATLKLIKNVQKMALHLADYFKFTIRNNSSHVTVAEEVKHIQNYLEIQKMRYPDLLEYVIDIPPPWDEAPIPPLSIQPFVENAIIHGMNMENEQFRIMIKAEEVPGSSERFVITVADNGKGFPPGQLEKLASGSYLQEADGSHIGIWNVIHRLGLYFEGSAEIRFSNDEPHGAVVQITVPFANEARPGGDDNV